MKPIDCAMEVLRRLRNKLEDHHFFSADYDERTEVLGYKVNPPLDIADELTDDDLERAAQEIVLKIREGSYETFVKLPLPQGVDIGALAVDPETKLAVRYVRCFNVIDGNFLTRFDVGVRA